MNRQDAKDAKTEPSKKADQVAHEVIGAAIEVHRVLGPGFLESVYEAALGIELETGAISFERKKPVPLRYKGRDIGEGRLDILADECVIVELKAVDALAPIHRTQVISYLKATGLTLGLLINFNVPLLKDGVERIVLS